MRSTLRVIWYRFRTTLASRRGALVGLVLLIGLVGGVGLAAIAGARRTQSSYPAFSRSTNPSDLTLQAFGVNTGGSASGVDGNTTPAALLAIAHLPHVRYAQSETLLLAGPVQPNGAPIAAVRETNFQALGSIDGLGFDQDRVTVTRGRMADPRRADEVVMTAGAAREAGAKVGDLIPIGAFTGAQISDPAFGTAKVQPHRRATVKLVGIVEFNTSVVQDDVDRGGAQYALFTPAFTGPLTACCGYGTFTGIKVDDTRNVTRVENEIAGSLPKGTAFYFHDSSVVTAKAERAIKPEALALAVFGVIATLAALLIAGQAIGRQLRLGTRDLHILRALGAGPATTSTDGLVGIVAAILVGSVSAAAVAIVLSPLAPLGPVRAVYPSRGLALDGTAVGLGVVGLAAALSVIAFAFAFRMSPHRVARRSRFAATRPSRVARAAATSGLPAPAVTGVRFALESGRSDRAVPMRSAIVGTALAVVVVMATLSFGASLRTLVSHPALYGWNFTYELDTPNGGSNVSGIQAAKLLDHDRDVAAWAGAYFDSLRLDGQTVPVLAEQPDPRVAPPLLSGRGFKAPDEVVLGVDTLAQLRKRVGDTVEAAYAGGAPIRLRIVGTATMPALGLSEELHPSMGTGAVVDYRLIPATSRNPQGNEAFDPSAFFVRIRSGMTPAASLPALRKIAAALSNPVGGVVSVDSVQRPAEIVNYRSMGNTPAILGAALAASAVVALALTLIASVRRRRRDLALLKTLGFTRRQLAATVAWQSTIAVAIGAAIGGPAGVFTGRWLWDRFAAELHVVPEPTVPVPTILLVAIGALVLANIVAAIPGLQAARTRTAVLLRVE